MLAFYSFLVCPVLSGSPPTTATCIYRYLPHKWFGIISAVQRSQDGCLLVYNTVSSGWGIELWATQPRPKFPLPLGVYFFQYSDCGFAGFCLFVCFVRLLFLGCGGGGMGELLFCLLTWASCEAINVPSRSVGIPAATINACPAIGLRLSA